MSSTDPTLPSDTLPSDGPDRAPPLGRLADAIPQASTRHLIATQLGRGATADGATKAVAGVLALALDWRELGSETGAPGPAARAMLLDTVRVLVDAVILQRASRTASARIPPPRRMPPDAPPVRSVVPISQPPDPADER